MSASKPTKSLSEDQKIARAVLLCATETKWQNLKLSSIAKNSSVSQTKLSKRFKSMNEFVPLITAEIDREMIASNTKMSGTPHDRLFDLIMARFDILQKYRPAILSMASAAIKNKTLAYYLSQAMLISVYKMIDKAAIHRPVRPILALGIVTIYSWSFLAWRKDLTPDLSKTMATLDRALRIATKTMEVLEKYRPAKY